MKPEEIKIGETYYIRVKADSKDSESVYCQLIDADGNGRKALSFYNWMLYSFTPVPAAPKYDPCRLFKKGDEVEYHPKDGRARPNLLVGRKYKVAADEQPCDSGIVQVEVEFDGLRHLNTFMAYNNLELVTPVEERSPYYVKETASVYEVFNRNENNSSVAIFFKSQYSIEKAKERAEAERDRLNAEYRKEHA